MSSLIPLIHKTLEDTNKDFVPQAHYPSSAGFRYSDGSLVGPDILSQYLKFKGIRPSNPPDGPSLMRMKIGDGAHEAVAKVLAKAGIKSVSEVAFKCPIPGLRLPISGRVDSLAELKDGELEVIEVKSAQESGMFGKGWGIRDKGPKEDHILQVICYLNNVPGVKRGRFLYVARDTGSMLEFVIEKSGDSYSINGKPVRELSWSGIVKRWGEIEAAVDLNQPPPPDYRAWLNKNGDIMSVKTIKGLSYKTPWRIEYDSYRDYVWKNPDNFKYSENAKHGLKPGE